jgi:uncharacterized protein (TIGR02246 family)
MFSNPKSRLSWLSAIAGLVAIGCLAATSVSAQSSAVEARLQALEDESEIRYLLDHYMDVLGAADWDAYVALFTEDGELVMSEGTRRGRDDIKERMAGATARMAVSSSGQPARRRAELLSNIRVKVEGDTASAQSRFTFLGEDADGSFRVTGSGLYTDALERGGDNVWRIKSRTVDYDMLRGAASASD